jgi:ribonucleoside-diphosphate reductase alpha chain
VTLAKERGRFPVYDETRERSNPFISRIREAAPHVYEEMQKYGRRNIALLTIAPTGTTSLMSQTSSGLEPAYMIAYKRRRKVNPNDKDVRITFTDKVGDSWEEYNVFHHKFETWLRVQGYDPDDLKNTDEQTMNEIIEKSPYYMATANDIDWVAKVRMQGEVQKWVDQSISVTVNVPKETTEQLIGEIYKTAWEVGCKGMTVYRDGSRSGVLVASTEKQEPEFKETFAPKRPEKLEAEIVRYQNDYEKWVAVVGIYKGRPYEIFTGKAERFYLPGWVERGWVIKLKNDKGGTRYDFQYEDRDGYKVTMEGLSRQFDKEYWNYAKLISGILRHGMPLQFVVHVVDSLNLASDSINTWKNGVVRALKKFIPDGTQVVTDEQCENCGEEEGLVYQEGCLVCTKCGHSKCG